VLLKYLLEFINQKKRLVSRRQKEADCEYYARIKELFRT